MARGAVAGEVKLGSGEVKLGSRCLLPPSRPCTSSEAQASISTHAGVGHLATWGAGDLRSRPPRVARVWVRFRAGGPDRDCARRALQLDASGGDSGCGSNLLMEGGAINALCCTPTR